MWSFFLFSISATFFLLPFPWLIIWVLRFVLESSTDKAQETAGHYDRNCGRGINLHNYLSPSSIFKNVTVFNLLVGKGSLGRISMVEYFKRDRKTELTLSLFHLLFPWAHEAYMFQHVCTFDILAWKSLPPATYLHASILQISAYMSPSQRGHSWSLY